MKYLKKFESIDDEVDLQELEDFCRVHLSYLIDEGFSLRVQEVFFQDYGETAFQIAIFPTRNITQSFFTGYKDEGIPFWRFKDRLIPFVYMLLKEYDLVTPEFISKTGLAAKTGIMGFFLDLDPKELKDPSVKLNSLDDLEDFNEQEPVKSFYIRVKNKE